MRRTASEVLRSLEMRVARLENRSAKVTSADLKMWFSARPPKVRVETQNGSKLKLKDVANMKGVNLYVYGVYNDGGEDSLLMLHIDHNGRLQKGWDRGLELG